MLEFLKNRAKRQKIQQKIEIMQAKAELLKYKALYAANSVRKNNTIINGAAKQIQANEDLKKMVADNLPDNTPAQQILQILQNDTVKELLTLAAKKFMLKGQVSSSDDDLISMYKELPSDIKKKVRDFAFDYIGKKQLVKTK